jgi:hypothetical protein
MNRFAFVRVCCRSAYALLIAGLLASCGGGGSGAQAPTTTTALAVASSTPASGATGVGVNAAITATFNKDLDAASCSASVFAVNPSVSGAVACSGATATFTPSSPLAYSTTYTATIGTALKDSSGNALAASYAWTFTTAAQVAASSDANLLGINIAAPLDYEEDRLYADVIRTARDFKTAADPGGTNTSVDADGWPTTDFSFYVWAGLANMHGSYRLSFTGQATVVANPGGTVALTYDAASNTSSATIQYTDAASGALALSFTGTKRSSGSASGTGVTAIKLMRPLTPGATQSFAATTLFNTPLKALIAKFSVIRFMDFLATNWNLQTNWSDRPLPAVASFQRKVGTGGYGWQGLGGPWEHVALLANETGKDAWINIPVRATDDYIIKVARLLAFGSDGVNPYTSTQANPVYPPLNANLKIYVEYSNELWNGVFDQFNDNCAAASSALSAGNSPLNWDGSWNHVTYNATTPGNWDWAMCDRQTTKRSVEISNIFRSVFGDAAMGARVRPVLMSQLTNAGATLRNQAHMLLEYYDNLNGNSGTPHAPGYYFYGAGGSGYYSPASVVTTLNAFFADPGMTPTGLITNQYGTFSMNSWFQDDAKLVAAMGLKRVAYEGGPDLGYTNAVAQTQSIVEAAVLDARMTTAIVNMHNAWSNDGGDLFVYYRSAGDAQWSFTQDVYNLATRKLGAIDALNAAARAPLTFGTAAPGSVAGSAWDACSSWVSASSNYTADGSNFIWGSYTFRSTAAAPWTVNLAFDSASNASVAVYVDGTLIGTKTTTGGALAFSAGQIGAGLHGVIVKASSGSFALNRVAVATN